MPSTGGRAGKEAHYEVVQQTNYTYDTAGRLSAITTNGFPAISYRYDDVGRVIQKSYGGDKPETSAIVANIGYDARSRLARIEFTGANLGSPKLLAYDWDPASQLTRRTWNGETQRYEYDPSGQLLKVLDDKTSEVLESYRYDLAGNMLEKIVGNQRTAMAYNAANQLVKVYDLPSTTDDVSSQAAGAGADLEKLARKVQSYSYDKAGRMLGVEGRGSGVYGWLDKMTELTQPDGSKVTFTYWPDGQLAAKSVDSNAAAESGIQQIVNRPSSIADDTFLWDGLALLKRNDTVYIVEPHPSGGIPVASHPTGRPDAITWHLSDLLGTTLATVERDKSQFARLTAFGQPLTLASNIPTTSSAQQDPDLTTPPVPKTQSIQRTTINP